MSDFQKKIMQVVLAALVSIATIVGTVFGVNALTSCETVDSISVGANIRFPTKPTTDFEENITNPPQDDDAEWSPDLL